jgi:DNA-binding beta-propeller fold protein YncE
MEFDADGTFVRGFGEGLFTRSHGLRIDHEDNIWATDVDGHVVMKFSPQGEVLLTLGTKGQPGVVNEPTDVAIARSGDVFIAQGHKPFTGGDARILKFDKTGKFLKSWGGKGKGPGQFEVPHGIAVDAKGQLWVSDRENQRIQIFDADGTFIKELKYAGLPCGVHIGGQHVYMVNGFAGQILRLDLDGNVLAATGKPGKGLGEFGEAHAIAVSPKGELYVADPSNRVVQKFVKK